MNNKAREFLGIGFEGKIELMDYYNRNCVNLVKPERRYKMKSTDQWCAMFVSVIAHKLGIENFPYEVSVFQQTKLAIEKGDFYNDYSMVSIGDLVVYDWNYDGTLDHVGIVDSVQSGVILVVEGNYQNTVGIRQIDADSRLIHGFIRVVKADGKGDEQRLTWLMEGVLKGYLGTGAERVEKLGADYHVVQKMVNEYLNSVK